MADQRRHDEDTLEAPFIFVRHGDPEPTDWMAQHPGWVKIPALFVPHGPRVPTPSALRGGPPDWSPGWRASIAPRGAVDEAAPIRPPDFSDRWGEHPIAAYRRISAALPEWPAPLGSGASRDSAAGANAPGDAAAGDTVSRNLRGEDPAPGDSVLFDVAFTANAEYAAEELGLSGKEFRRKIHKLKDAWRLGGRDNVLFEYPSGDVWFNGEVIGNLFDE